MVPMTWRMGPSSGLPVYWTNKLGAKGVDLILLLETIASLPLRCGVFKQYGGALPPSPA